MEIRKVLITGITGSGGSYLAEHIVRHHPHVEVHGVARWHRTTGNHNLSEIQRKARVHECDLLDFSNVARILRDIRPDAIFHLASHANVHVSFTSPLSVMHNNIMGTANLLEAIRLEGQDPVVQLCSNLRSLRTG